MESLFAAVACLHALNSCFALFCFFPPRKNDSANKKQQQLIAKVACSVSLSPRPLRICGAFLEKEERASGRGKKEKNDTRHYVYSFVTATRKKRKKEKYSPIESLFSPRVSKGRHHRPTVHIHPNPHTKKGGRGMGAGSRISENKSGSVPMSRTHSSPPVFRQTDSRESCIHLMEPTLSLKHDPTDGKGR